MKLTNLIRSRRSGERLRTQKRTPDLGSADGRKIHPPIATQVQYRRPRLRKQPSPASWYPSFLAVKGEKEENELLLSPRDCQQRVLQRRSKHPISEQASDLIGSHFGRPVSSTTPKEAATPPTTARWMHHSHNLNLAVEKLCGNCF